MPSRPTFSPQLATLVDAPPEGDDWLHEIKFDGYRIGCLIRNGHAALISRNGNDWTAAFPEVARAALDLKTDDALIDGEVVMVLPDGRTSFQALQNASSGKAARDTLVYYVFDLIRLDGQRLDHLPLEERKKRLLALVGRRTTGRIRYASDIVGKGAAFFAQACKAGLEGIVSKRRGRPYTSGRHGDWLKVKCTRRQEFVVGGFTDPQGMRAGLGALLVGYYDRDRLIYSGRVGTGFSHKLALDLRRQLESIGQKTCPFAPPPGTPASRRYEPVRGAHWVSPRLVAEVSFTEWTNDGKIRHPSFLGLRADKKARDVRREQEAIVAPVSAAAPRSPGVRRASARPTVLGVGISHPDRVVYEEPRLTKLDVARYYESIQQRIVPHVAGRPLTLMRCPEGMQGTCFYMKHAQGTTPPALRRVRIHEKKKVGEYLIADDAAGVVSLVQLGVLEIHTWNSTLEDIERPNRIVIDLDPGADVEWAQVIAAARSVRAALEALDLESWVKTTGGRGLHVVAPLEPYADWSECLDFTRALSEALERAEPSRYTTEFSKARRTRRILIDYLRNSRGSTSVAAYSTRARPGAPVSMPLRWEELRTSVQPGSLTVASVPARLDRADDPWKGYWKCRQRLTKQRIKALASRRT